jgi:hypothetical protein
MCQIGVVATNQTEGVHHGNYADRLGTAPKKTNALGKIITYVFFSKIEQRFPIIAGQRQQEALNSGPKMLEIRLQQLLVEIRICLMQAPWLRQ